MTDEATELVKKVSDKQTLEMVLASFEDGKFDNKKITSDHVTTLIAQRGQIAGYINQDRKDYRWDQKFYFIASLLFAMLVLGGLAFIKPEYLSEAIVALVSGLGGYGYGKGTAGK